MRFDTIRSIITQVESIRSLAKKFVTEPDRVTVDDCRRLLEELGYQRPKKPGSHAVYHKNGAYPITVPTPHSGRYVKSPYVKRIVKLLNLEEYLEGEEGDEPN